MACRGVKVQGCEAARQGISDGSATDEITVAWEDFLWCVL